LAGRGRAGGPWPPAGIRARCGRRARRGRRPGAGI